MKIDGQKVLIVYEEGKAPWSKPLCKLGFHDWRKIFRAERGFNTDFCRRDCSVSRYWKAHKK